MSWQIRAAITLIAWSQIVLIWNDCDASIRYEIDQEASWLRVVPGVPDLERPFDPIEVGSRILNAWGLLEQFDGSLEVSVAGFWEAEPGNVSIQNSEIRALPNVAEGVFQPTIGIGGSTSTTNNFAVTDHLTGEIVKIAVRDAVIRMQGNILVGRAAEVSFVLAGGTLDFEAPDLDRDGNRDTGFIELASLNGTTFVTPRGDVVSTPDSLPNSSTMSVTGDDTVIEIPISVEVPISLVQPNDSHLVMEGLLVGNRVISELILGDFDRDGTLSSNDFDLLLDALAGPRDLEFDLTDDGNVDSADISAWTIDIFGTVAGDTNLDKEVSFEDFLALSTSFGMSGTWREGDFDADGEVGFPDFLALSHNFGTKVSAAVVPEPKSAAFLVWGFLLLGMCKRSPGKSSC